MLHIVLTTAVFLQCTIYTVLSRPLGVIPPNNIALLLDSFVRVKISQGGGPFPVISGTIQLPEIQTVIILYWMCKNINRMIYCCLTSG